MAVKGNKKVPLSGKTSLPPPPAFKSTLLSGFEKWRFFSMSESLPNKGSHDISLTYSGICVSKSFGHFSHCLCYSIIVSCYLLRKFPLSASFSYLFSDQDCLLWETWSSNLRLFWTHIYTSLNCHPINFYFLVFASVVIQTIYIHNLL